MQLYSPSMNESSASFSIALNQKWQSYHSHKYQKQSEDEAQTQWVATTVPISPSVKSKVQRQIFNDQSDACTCWPSTSELHQLLFISTQSVSAGGEEFSYYCTVLFPFASPLCWNGSCMYINNRFWWNLRIRSLQPRQVTWSFRGSVLFEPLSFWN